MIKNGKYIYYMVVGTAAGGPVYRVNVTTGKKKKLTDFLTEGDYTVVNNTLFYSYLEWAYSDGEDYEYMETAVANLDGSYPEVIDVIIYNTLKKSNAKNYRVYSKRKGRYYYDYLKTPKGKFYIGKTKIPAGY